MHVGLIIVRTLHFWAVAILVGGAGFRLLLRRPFQGDVGALRLAAFAAAMFGFGWFTLVFIGISDGPSGLFDRDTWSAFLGAPFGPPWEIRLGILAVGVAIIPRAAAWPCLVVGVGLAIDQAWLGHAATGAGSTAVVEITADAAHILAAFTWVGALVMLGVASLAARRVPGDGLMVFSTIGIVLVITILASGIVNAGFRMGSLRDLVTTPYGIILSTKIAIFTTMVALAIANRRALRRKPQPDHRLTVSVIVEAGLGVAALAAAAALGVTAPPF